MAETGKLLRHVRDEERLAVVQAPPGSGKTHLLLQAVREEFRRKRRVVIATQTRSQADDICRRLARDFQLPAIRFVAQSGASPVFEFVEGCYNLAAAILRWSTSLAAGVRTSPCGRSCRRGAAGRGAAERTRICSSPGRRRRLASSPVYFWNLTGE